MGKNLRSDYVLYIVGVALLVVTGYTLFTRESLEDAMGGMLIYSAIIFVLALFGITAFIFGYNLRPQKQNLLSVTPSPIVESFSEAAQVEGIDEKRAKQIRTIDIATVVDLSATSI